LQEEKANPNVMNVLLENIQIKNVVKLAIVVLQEHQMILKNNHHALVVERDQNKIKDVN